MNEFPDLTKTAAAVSLARRQKGLTQAQLAKLTDVNQSALSMFERGRRDALSAENIQKVLRSLNLDPEVFKEGVSPQKLGCCPNEECIGAKAHRIGGKVLVTPRFVELPAGTEKAQCELCGEPFILTCQNCHAAVARGFFCSACGTPYLLSLPEDLSALPSDRDAVDSLIKDFNETRQALLQALYPVPISPQVRADGRAASTIELVRLSRNDGEEKSG